MINNPYEAQLCPKYDLTRLKKEIILANINDELIVTKSLSNKVYSNILQISPVNKTIPQFYQPIVLNELDNKILIDTRALIRYQNNGLIEVTVKNEFQFFLLRAILMDAWMKNENKNLLNLGDIHIAAFVKFLTNQIVKRFNFNPLEYQQISAISGFYYLCLFNPSDVFDGDENQLLKLKFAQKISQITKVPDSITNEIFEKLNYIDTIDGFVESIKKIISNPKTDLLNTGLVVTLLAGSWFGNGSREIVATSLEYPPNFIALVFMALTDRTYHSTYFTKTVETVNNKNSGENFLRALKLFLEGYADE